VTALLPVLDTRATSIYLRLSTGSTAVLYIDSTVVAYYSCTGTVLNTKEPYYYTPYYMIVCTQYRYCSRTVQPYRYQYTVHRTACCCYKCGSTARRRSLLRLYPTAVDLARQLGSYSCTRSSRKGPLPELKRRPATVCEHEHEHECIHHGL
jgi:hypothetical protein